MEFNIDTATAPQPQFTVDSGVAPPSPPSDEVAQSRAAKTHMGLSDVLKQDYQSIYNAIANGQESMLRENAALEITNKAMQDRQKQLLEVAAQKGKNLTYGDVQALSAPPTDPSSVVEKSYSRAYVNTINDAAARIEGTVLDDAKAEDPVAVKAYMDAATDVMTKREYALTKAENAKGDADKNAWFGFDIPGLDHRFNFGSYDVKQLLSLGFYESAMLRGNTKDSSRLGWLGNVLEAQAQELRKLPFEEFQRELDKIGNNLSNSDPILAEKFYRAVAGMSSGEQGVYNATELINAATTLSVFAPAEGVAKNIGQRQMRNLGGLERGPDGVYRPTGPRRPSGGPGEPAGALNPPESTNVASARQAISDVLNSSASPSVSKATMAAGAGDLQEAGVQKAVQSATRQDPKQNALDTLLSIHKTDTEALRNNPGNLSREQHTRLLDAADGFEKNTVDLLINSSKVSRTPVLVEDGFRAISDKIKNYFPGKENTILDVDVRYDPISNTYHHDVKIGNYDGTAFPSYEQAQRHAELNGYPVNIEGKVSDYVYLPASAAKSIESIKATPKGTRFYADNGVEIVPSANYVQGHVAYNIKTQKFEKPPMGVISQQGLGFYIIVPKPLNETETFVRDGLIGDYTKSVSNKDTTSLTKTANAVIGLIRSPYDTLSKAENENRAKVVFGQSKFIDAVQEEMKSVEDIYKGILGDGNWIVEKPLSYARVPTGANKQVAKDFTRALEASQTMPDPKTGLPGYYMKTPAEIQHFWQTNFHRPPSFKEQQAYLAIGRTSNFDHILRNIQEYTYKARVGVERWNFTINREGQRITSPVFDARQVKTVNASTDEVSLIVDATGAEKYWHQMGTKAQNEFRQEVLEGKWLGVELWNPEERPLKRTDTEGNPMRIRYVWSNAFERKPLTYDQVGYRGGGHWLYDYSHAVKQPIIRPQRVGSKVQHIYEGDTTFVFVGNRTQGIQFAKDMNALARLIRARDIRGAKQYVKDHFDISWKEIYKGFRPSKDTKTGELIPPRFSTDPRQEFRVVPQGKTIHDLDKELSNKFEKRHPKTDVVMSTFVDGTRHGSLARNFQIEFTQPRESYAMNEVSLGGSTDRPFYNFRSAKLLDPITTLTRSMTRLVNSTYMNDLKISAVEHWLQENIDILDGDVNSIRSAPFYYFNEGKFKNNPDNALRIINARTNRYKIQQFIGTPSVIDTAVQAVKQELSDARHGANTKLGKAARAPLIVPEWMLDRLHNPIDFGRAMTYHLTLGLFSIKQVVVQSMAYTTIFGIAGPKAASAGSYAALMHQWTRINRMDNKVIYFDSLAPHFGWKLGQMAEAMKLLEKTGFGTIKNELSLDTDAFRKQLFFRNDLKGLLDVGQIPFHEGNLNVRFGAFYTAFWEYRQKNPFTKIGPTEEGQILHRANILNATMTRDANTVLNKGLVGIPFQFFDYMKKMTDLFWGKNIGEDFSKKLVKNADGTYREESANDWKKRSYIRARMFFMYAMLGGVAGATGVSGIPFNDMLRKSALSGDLPGQQEMYIPGDKLLPTLLMEGPVSTLVAFLTGYGDISKGTFYNFNNRFNPNGMQIIRDIMQTDPSFWKILTGATGTTVGNELSSLSGFVNAMYSMIEGDPAKEAWPLKLDDWVAPLDNISSWRDSERLAYALAFGKWRDRHGATMQSDVSRMDALFRSITGLNDQNIEDMYLKVLTQKDRQALYDKAFKEFEEQSRKAEDAASNGDTEQANDYNKRAFFALTSRNVPTELWGKALSRRAQMNRDRIEKNNESYYLKYVPTNKQQQAIEAYRKIQQKK